MDRAAMASVPTDVIALCERLRSQGKRAWIVGGCVRDLLLGRAAADWDVATDARPKELLSIFPRAIPTGIDHGTVTVVQHGHHYEVTTLRGEGTYSDGRRPDWVEFVDDITADLARRDFTVNAMAIDPVDAQLIDPFDGRVDLQRGVLRAVGNPQERFAEDGLRVLRAARFVATLELELDPATRAAIPADARHVPQGRDGARARRVGQDDEGAGAVAGVRGDARDGHPGDHVPRAPRGRRPRRRTGFTPSTCGATGSRAWTRATPTRSCGSLRFSTTSASPGRAPGPTRRPTTRSTTTTGSARRSPSRSPHACGSRTTTAFASSRSCSTTSFTTRTSGPTPRCAGGSAGWDRTASRTSTCSTRPTCARKGKDFEPDLAALAALKAHVARVIAQGAALSTRDLKVNGHDLIRELAIRPGPVIGQILDALLEAVTTDPTLNERERLLAAAREYLKSRGN